MNANVSTVVDNALATLPASSRYFQIRNYQWLAQERLRAKLGDQPALAAICDNSMRRQLPQLKPARS